MPAIHASTQAPPASAVVHPDAPNIGEILDRGGIITEIHSSSKKKLLEQIAELFAEKIPGSDSGKIFSTLIERENLGSTGIGHGVALPHGRIARLDEVAGFFLRLQTPLEFDAVDHLPVDLVFAILVPEQATEEHLKLLASLASIFRDEQARKQLLESSSPAIIRDIFNTYNVNEQVNQA